MAAKKKGKSPTQCTLDKWRKVGYTVAVVEKWNPHMKIRQDLFGFIDVLAIGKDETVAIQSTTKHNLKSRITKIESDDLFEKVSAVREAGWRIIAEGWHKPKHRWECEEVDLS